MLSDTEAIYLLRTSSDTAAINSGKPESTTCCRDMVLLFSGGDYYLPRLKLTIIFNKKHGIYMIYTYKYHIAYTKLHI